MLFVLVFIFVLLLIYGPHLWIRHVMARHGGTLDELPGTGGELARHLIERFGLGDVEVEATDAGDHYDSVARKVRLSPDIMNGRSLTAVAVAAHEVGHAIQYHRQERITHLRQHYSPLAMTIQKIAIGILIAAPLLAAIFHLPQIALVTVLAGVLAMLASVLIQMIILPMEWDASFNKALPILMEGEYLAPDQYPAAKSVLRAAALTYVAAALVDMLRFGRWLAILRAAIR
ncbi:zinc metallopeptidase [Allohahella marinimesophila]|uniref:Zinc metallopeptidase n=1 Tax=Allohahella marinimesophila TaxID=1054972 RepID=A0ABP7NRA4_9GAMM